MGTLVCECGNHSFGDRDAKPENMKTLQSYFDELGYDKLHPYRDNWGLGWGRGREDCNPNDLNQPFFRPNREIMYITDVRCPICGRRYALWVWREFTDQGDADSAVYRVEDMSYYETFNDEPPREEE